MTATRIITLFRNVTRCRHVTSGALHDLRMREDLPRGLREVALGRPDLTVGNFLAKHMTLWGQLNRLVADDELTFNSRRHRPFSPNVAKCFANISCGDAHYFSVFAPGLVCAAWLDRRTARLVRLPNISPASRAEKCQEERARRNESARYPHGPPHRTSSRHSSLGDQLHFGIY